MYIDDPKYVIAHIKKLCETTEGQELVRSVVQNGRTAIATQELLEFMQQKGMLGRTIAAEEMQEIATLIYYYHYQLPFGKLVEYINSIPDEVKNGFETPVGNC